LNTGWVGGPYGIGKRISIKYTRAMLNAALNGALKDVPYTTDPIFGFEVPKCCPDVPDSVLDPASSWVSRDAYMKRYRSLASRFIDNFKKYEDAVSQDVKAAGPRL
jgi:phosphoenolpyruvate carboxykinase (ATP)